MEIQDLTHEELLDKYVRLAADFDNFRKNKEREVQSSRQNGVVDFLKKIIFAFDVFRYLINNETDEGVRLSAINLFKALEDAGVVFYGEEGDVFDDETMEAVSLDKSGKFPNGTVSVILTKGCRYNDQIIRYAKVVVAKI